MCRLFCITYGDRILQQCYENYRTKDIFTYKVTLSYTKGGKNKTVSSIDEMKLGLKLHILTVMLLQILHTGHSLYLTITKKAKKLFHPLKMSC